MGLDRRAALWDSRALKSAPDLPLFAYAEARDEGPETEPAQLPAMPLSEHVVNDYQTIRLSLKAHPMSFLREHYAARKFITAEQLKSIRDGKRLSIAGLVLIRQRPGSAKGVVFITIEDETGIANLVVWPDVFEKQRKIVMGARLMAVHGIVQRDEDDGVIHVVARRLEDDSHMLRHLSEDMLAAPLCREAMRPAPCGRRRAAIRATSKSSRKVGIFIKLPPPSNSRSARTLGEMRVAASICLFLAAASTAQPTAPAPIEGLWRNPSGTAIIEIAPCGGLLCGKVVWASERGQREAAKGAPQVVGTTVLTGLQVHTG